MPLTSIIESKIDDLEHGQQDFIDFNILAPGKDAQEFLCGWGAAVINITITFPVNKAMFRQQLHGIKIHEAVAQLRKEGLRNLYRGFLPPLLQKTTSLSIMFGMYNKYGKLLNRTAPDFPKVVNKGLAAAMAGCTEALLTPFERVQTLLQDRQHQKHFKNTYHAFRAIRMCGIQEYYRGLAPICFRNGCSNVMFFTLRGPIRNVLPATSSDSANIAADFFSGAVLGALISTIFYPLNVVKTRMQSVVGGEFKSTRQVFRIVWTERHHSWTRMFYGVHVNYSRSLLSWGIINASYELLKNFFEK